MKNRLTSHEKQMPYLRLPLRMAVLSSVDLFIALIFVAVWYLNGNTPGAIAIGVVLGCPALVALILYTNHLIAFDKDRFVYRSFSRKLYRYTFQDILKIEEDGDKIYIYTSDQKIRINDNSRNGIWFMELAGRKKQEDEEIRLGAEEREARAEAIIHIFISIVFLAMFGGIYIWITLFDPNTRLLRNMFLFASVLGILAGIVAISEYIAAGPGRNYPDGTPRGIYLLSKQGEIITGMKNPKFIWGVIFLCCGLFLNVIYPFFYALSILCFVRLGSLKLTLRNLHKKSDRRIEKVLHKYYPSRDLEERLRKAGRPIPHNTVPYNDSDAFDENEAENEEEDLFDKIFFLIPAILGIIAIIFVFFNFYIHDGRFEKTTELDMSFRFARYDASTNFTKEHFGRIYTLIPTDKELAEYRVYIKGLDHYGEFPELLEKHIDEKTVFHTISTFQDGERLQILQVSDKNGTVIFSTEACKQRRKDIALQWIKILVPITLGLTVVGLILTRKNQQSSEEPDTEEEESTGEEAFDREKERNDILQGSRLYRHNFYSSFPLSSLALYTLIPLIIVFITLIFLPFTDISDDQAFSYQIVVSDYNYDTNKFLLTNWLNLYDEKDEEYSISHFDRYGRNQEDFFQAIENGATFYITCVPEDSWFHIYSISDEKGTSYYTAEDATKAEKYYELGDAVFWSIPAAILSFLTLIYFLLLRYLDKMPKFIVDLMLTAEYPTEKFIDALPDSYGRVKKNAIKRHEKWQKKIEKQLDEKEKEETA